MEHKIKMEVINSKLKILVLALEQYKEDDLHKWIGDCLEDVLRDIDCMKK